jgi:Tol biopolymer transport system component
MRADGSGLHSLDPSLSDRFAGSFEADWSPDGSRLSAVFESKDKVSAVGIALMDPKTGTAREIKQLALPGANPEYPQWSPDGRFLAYEAVTEGSWDVWVVSAGGRNPHRLTADPGNERSPTWSPDGKFLYFIKDNHAVWRIPMDDSANAAGPAQLWARFAKTTLIREAIAFTKDQAVIAITEDASDLWLVEFPEK